MSTSSMVAAVRAPWSLGPLKPLGPHALVAVVSAVLALFPALLELAQYTDHGFHQGFALRWYESGSPAVVLPHPAYHLLWMMFYGLSGARDQVLPGLILYLLPYTAVGLIAYRWVTTYFVPDLTPPQRYLVAFGTALVQFMAPIALFTIGQQNLYLGYVHFSTYHNPTTILLRPFALLQYIWLVESLHPRQRKWLSLLGIALCSTAAVFAKPNYAIAFLPILILLVLYQRMRHRSIDGWVILALGLPTMVSLVLQSLVLTETRGGISIDVGYVWFAYTPSAAGLAIKFVMSVFFPAAVYLLFPKVARKSAAINISWCVFATAFVQSWLFIEGTETSLGNFLWGPYVALLVLFYTSFGLFVQTVRKRRKFQLLHAVRISAAAIVLIAHAGSGLFWWFQHLPVEWGGAGDQISQWW